MDLFPPDPSLNLLPCDGDVRDFGRLYQGSEADEVFAGLLAQIPWVPDEVMMFGKRLQTARMVAWFGDQNFAYQYSGMTRRALPWLPDLSVIKQRVERATGESFNSCLLNLYHHGNEGMGWHSDDEPVLEKHAAIASLSFGAERRFCFKHKSTAQKVEIALGHGHLLLMKGTTQEHWLHAVPKSTRVREARVNLTFRRFIVRS